MEVSASLMTTAVGTASTTPKSPPILAPVRMAMNTQKGFNPVTLPNTLGAMIFSTICWTIRAAARTCKANPMSLKATRKVTSPMPTEPPKGTSAIKPMVRPNSKPKGTFSSRKTEINPEAMQVARIICPVK